MLSVRFKRGSFKNCLRVVWRSIQTSSQMYRDIEDEHMKTSVNFITHPKEGSSKHKPAYVTRYGPKGFVVHGSRVLGSLVILPGLFLHWKVKNPHEICLESLELFTLVKPPIDIIVIGTGDKVVKLDKEIHRELRKKRIALEVQDTANACATYNFLLEEGRVTGAALIPPTLLHDR
ncbi:NADH dehydrogenase [ubiquinone] 1 alpha subcomplex assembly factor 3-like [Dendronephthya gigantea]|uniref:NADH dehydrogenase [ubiquinone] 1 alpha subcomplex assembly factor 3-like n=1 Tax=Dendronephthya gigantea TaxID=151771 RepID=UPI00106A0B02|nr:NADH dehydrogenase [ubiquinone] 1 alpha subcomplex assembly factor 3-like [Dendronephthya gigantea]